MIAKRLGFGHHGGADLVFVDDGHITLRTDDGRVSLTAPNLDALTMFLDTYGLYANVDWSEVTKKVREKAKEVKGEQADLDALKAIQKRLKR